MEWRHSGSPRPKKIPSAKIRWKSSRLDFFWDQDGILLTDYLPKSQTTNAQYYSSLLVKLKDKRRVKVIKMVLFLHNAPAPRALATQKKLAYTGFQCLDHPPYSPDLAPSVYHLFPGLKKQLKGRRRGGHCCRGDLVGRTTFWFFFFWVAYKTYSNGLRSVLSFVERMLNKSRVWSL